MSRAWVWIPLLIGWLPVWALFTVLMMAAHQLPLAVALTGSLRLVVAAAALGFLVQRLTLRLPWPHPFRLRFIGLHALAAAAYALAWIALNSLIDSVLRGRLALITGPGLVPFLVTGIWFYVMIAGISYANRTAERQAQLAMLEARSQLAALRMQLQPHFLFNALHTVVQLIPLDPAAAVRAAEQLAALLRRAIEEQRDLVPLADEWRFVERYLALERIRFGERLIVRTGIAPATLDARVPSFALQTLVENAVRHAAAPSIAATTVTIAARRDGARLVVEVRDDGPGAEAAAVAASAGTGLRRLRERLVWLHGGNASLDIETAPGRGLCARLAVPFDEGGDDAEGGGGRAR